MTTVLISGAGIAGPSLAFWLSRYGYDVTVVEQARGLRASGAAVDFRGDQMALLERMGILAEMRSYDTAMGDQLIVDAAGRQVSRLPSVIFSGELEIERGDLSGVLYRHTKDGVDYVFGDRITALDEQADSVYVTFEHRRARRFDLVVGADGQHSGVRRLAFGDGFQVDLGYYTAGFSMPNVLGLDHSARIYNEPGRYVNVSSARNPRRAAVSLVFASPELAYDRRDLAEQKRIIAEHYGATGWVVPQLLRELEKADDLYFASLSQIQMPRWSTGRIALLGDAAWCGGPGASGTGYAMLGAYTLAGELVSTGDHAVAFARYEEAMRPATTKSAKFATGAGKFLAPATEAKIRRRNRTYRFLSSRPMTGLINKLAKGHANTGDLADYQPLTTV
ncbi:FAD-dependent monooxygenase [Fodinicola acaciae]|uniref:FAD-dependent monooxygenase n=1 Tax=Fodinicola acaciae TaxID=2681555 RepID=UPI0013D753D4|nr:FAD-dependent monooxygenase [Fodinicola acaciae]